MKLISGWIGNNLIAILTLSLVLIQGVYGFGTERGQYEGLKVKVEELGVIALSVKTAEWKIVALEAALMAMKEDRAKTQRILERLIEKQEYAAEQLNQLVGELKKRRPQNGQH